MIAKHAKILCREHRISPTMQVSIPSINMKVKRAQGLQTKKESKDAQADSDAPGDASTGLMCQIVEMLQQSSMCQIVKGNNRKML